MEVANELTSIPEMGGSPDNIFDQHRKYVKNFKKTVLMVAGSAVQKLSETMAKEQEILMNVADMAIQTYVAESLLLRVEKLAGQKGEDAVKEQIEMLKVFIYDAADRINKAGKDALFSFADGDEMKMMMMGLKRFTKIDPFNVKESRRVVAAKIIDANKYPF